MLTTEICDYKRHNKVKSEHLKRKAYLYIRQSTLRQVFENTESTKRQYALKERAIAMGWPIEQIVVIDSDLGQSGASMSDREGFKKLVSEVGMGNAGIVLGLEVSRLARNCSDWHRLLEISALTDTLICDEDGLYDPAHFNDRLLLGLKGTMSEAELHVLKTRLQGGLLNKARRGELRTPLPIGFVYDDDGVVRRDPDKQVRKSIEMFFNAFEKTGSATATVKYFKNNGLKFPIRLRKVPDKHSIIWRDLGHSRTLQTLHNPRYAGAFFYGRTHTLRSGDGNETRVSRPIEEWHTLRKDAHEGYISWTRYESNLKILSDNARAYGCERRKSPPREGPALLQGIVICGVCGKRMTVRYHSRCEKRIPVYVCQRDGIEKGEPICQSVPGEAIDAAMSTIMIESVKPLTLEMTIKVQKELEGRALDIEKQHFQQVQRARYEADLARQRYMNVDPNNRLVADTLEAEWNGKLKSLTQNQDSYERLLKMKVCDTSETKALINTLVNDFSKVWNNPHTPVREKKRMIRLVIEDVTLIKDKQITIHIRYMGGAHKTISVPLPIPIGRQRATEPEAIKMIDQLLDDYTDKEIAMLLNKKGLKTGIGNKFHSRRVQFIRRIYKLKSRKKRLEEKGFITYTQYSKLIGVSKGTLSRWVKQKVIHPVICNGKGELLFKKPDSSLIGKIKALNQQGRGANFIKSISNRIKGAQYET